MTIRELCEKEVVQLEQGVCLGRADDLAFDPATALTIPWQEIETIGTDAVLVHTQLPSAAPSKPGLWQSLRARLGL